MITTYVVAEFEPTDKTVEVTYFNENNFEYKRIVNIPHFEDGSVDEVYFQEILNGQLSGVENKLRVGVIEFRDPTAESIGIAST